MTYASVKLFLADVQRFSKEKISKGAWIFVLNDLSLIPQGASLMKFSASSKSPQRIQGTVQACCLEATYFLTKLQ